MNLKDEKKERIDRLEEEYELEENSESKAGKRLRAKEKYSRKSHLTLKEGRILEVYTNGMFRVKVGNVELVCPLSGRYKNVEFSSRTVLAIGDIVRVDYTDNPRIEEICERKNSLRRFIKQGSRLKEVVIAANIDQVIIVSSVDEPPFNSGLIDRFLTAAELSDITPVICVNKYDLADHESDIRVECEYYINAGYRVIKTSTVTGLGIETLRSLLKERETVFSGASGTGKSSLINIIEPGLKLKVGEVSKVTSKGMHTTSSGSLIGWSFGGYLIDTPGIKTFGLSEKDKEWIPRKFPGFAEYAKYCRFTNCQHKGEIGCEVEAALSRGEVPPARYQSYLNLLNSL